MELSNRAKDQEYAGKERRFDYIDKNMEAFLRDYDAFLKKIEKLVSDGSESAISLPTSREEWTKDEVVQIANKFLSLVDEFNFGEIFDILENISRLDMGPQTKGVFEDIEKIMNEMDIDALKTKLGDLIS